jgi:hypothetical protein
MTDKELLQQALAALCVSSEPKSGHRRNELQLTPKLHIELYMEAIEAIRTRLAQPEMINGLTEKETNETMSVKGLSKPKKEWVGLTDEEKEDMLKGSKNAYDAIERIEAKLKEKNT